jgi:membrane protease YdiL (CAAX protease family)
VVAFFALACGISWLLWSPLWLPALGVHGLPVLPLHHALGALGPIAAAFVMSAAESGKAGPRDLLRRMVLWRGRLRWVAVALVGPFAILAVAVAVAAVFGGDRPSLAGLGRSRELPELPALAFLAYNLVTFGWGEEAGWRGFALPRLQARRSALAATLLLTAGWALWHAPLFLYRPGYVVMDAAGVAGWLVSLATGAILLTWLYNESGGSILVVALFHASIDAVFTSQAASPLVTSVTGMLVTAWGIAVLVAGGPARLSRRGAGRFDVLREIERLDPQRDNQRIMHLSFGWEFPWDSIRALEVALYRTYAMPSVSGLLDRTGEFYRASQRRYDDTAILIAEMCKHGYEGGRGLQALERMNWAHGHFKIANDDFLYVLSTFVFEPIRWIDAYGWRRLSRNERLGYFCFWREVGKRMGIRDIPESYDAFLAWSMAREEAHLRFEETNRNIAIATRDLFASWFPRFLAPAVHAGVYAVLDDAMLRAFGFPRPPATVRALVRGSLKLRGRFVRWLPPRNSPSFFVDRPNRTYPLGWEISSLGPPRLVAKERGESPR